MLVLLKMNYTIYYKRNYKSTSILQAVAIRQEDKSIFQYHLPTLYPQGSRNHPLIPQLPPDGGLNETHPLHREPFNPSYLKEGNNIEPHPTTAAQKATQSSSKASLPEEAPTLGTSHLCLSRPGDHRLSRRYLKLFKLTTRLSFSYHPEEELCCGNRATHRRERSGHRRCGTQEKELRREEWLHVV